MVWVPLRASVSLESAAEWGHVGHTEEFFGLGSVAFPVEQKAAAEMLRWEDVGVSDSHCGRFQNGRYVPADAFNREELNGVALVLEQDGNRDERTEWHLHQDLVITLELKREDDVWLAINECYLEVARLKRKPNAPSLLEVRAEHLKDYRLSAGICKGSGFQRTFG